MNDYIFGVLNPADVQETDEWPQRLETQNDVSRGIDVRTTIDGEGESVVQYGHAAADLGDEREVPNIKDDGSIEYNEQVRPRWVGTEFIADLPRGYVAVSSSEGEFLFDIIRDTYDVAVVPALIDIEGFYEHITEGSNHDIWQFGWKEEDEEGETTAAGVTYHSDTHRAPPEGISQLGFTIENPYDPHPDAAIRGTLARSGYLGLYDPDYWGTQDVGTWFQDAFRQFLVYDVAPDESNMGIEALPRLTEAFADDGTVTSDFSTIKTDPEDDEDDIDGMEAA